LLAFNDQAVLEGAGTVSNEDMKRIVQTRYDEFDQKRKRREADEADADDLKSLETLEQRLKNKRKD